MPSAGGKGSAIPMQGPFDGDDIKIMFIKDAHFRQLIEGAVLGRGLRNRKGKQSQVGRVLHCIPQHGASNSCVIYYPKKSPE